MGNMKSHLFVLKEKHINHTRRRWNVKRYNIFKRRGSILLLLLTNFFEDHKYVKYLKLEKTNVVLVDKLFWYHWKEMIVMQLLSNIFIIHDTYLKCNLKYNVWKKMLEKNALLKINMYIVTNYLLIHKLSKIF